MHACIYSQTIAVPANVFVEFDLTLNEDYLILKKLISQHITTGKIRSFAHGFSRYFFLKILSTFY